MDSTSDNVVTTGAKRFALYLHSLFGGNQTLMAETVGISQGVISKIVLGKQEPGQRVLSALASHPKVNPDWLYRGEGEPLLADRPEAPSGGWPVQVSKQLLPGRLADFSHTLAGPQLPVAGSFFTPTRYAFEVQAAMPMATDPTGKVAPGDLILIETDVDAWLVNPRGLMAELVVVVDEATGVPHLGRVDDVQAGLAGTCEVTVTTFGDGKYTLAVVNHTPEDKGDPLPWLGPGERHQRAVDIKKHQEKKYDGEDKYPAGVLVGVAVFLWRAL